MLSMANNQSSSRRLDVACGWKTDCLMFVRRKRRANVMLLAAASIVVCSCSISTTVAGYAVKQNYQNDNQKARILVIGGGASGIFASIHAATDSTSVTVLESGRRLLTKVAISGGGRCNVLPDERKSAPEILAGYPRGNKELRGILHKRFPMSAAASWFREHGVTLKVEPDGRMFPITDSSQSVIDALLSAAKSAGVNIQTNCKVQALEKNGNDSTFRITYKQKDVDGNAEENTVTEIYDAVILATGSAPSGYALVKNLGIDFVDTVPSLFTLSTKHAVQEGGLLNGLAGVSVHGMIQFCPPDDINNSSNNSKKSSGKKKRAIAQEGPLLITHHGFSGPAALKLSAFGAREFEANKYRGTLQVHWAPDLGTVDEIFDLLWAVTKSNPKKHISSHCPILFESGTTAIPKRLWSALVQHIGLQDTVWGQASKKLVRPLAEQIAETRIEMTGKGTFKEEFVTAGGVSLKCIDMTTMQSRQISGLFFCGELIDVDGITGGYNFLNCWSTGYIAGTSSANFVSMQEAKK